jgi:hypothetical protein
MSEIKNLIMMKTATAVKTMIVNVGTISVRVFSPNPEGGVCLGLLLKVYYIL